MGGRAAHPGLSISQAEEKVLPISSDANRIYAIGDIHGRLDLLDRAIAAIKRDVDERGPAALTITLGDYVDRGPNSFGVIDRLAANPFPTDYVALKGNHEDLFGIFMDDPGVGENWRSGGCLETLHSYGVPVSDIMTGRGYDQASRDLRAAVPEHHMEFLRSLKLSLNGDRYFFCHAGVRPGIPLETQTAKDLMWIRYEFLDSGADFGRIVVHGHTPMPEPEVMPNRMNIDTGAFASGRLTCVALDDSGHRFLTV